jgi:hypothetical protein
MLLLLVAVPVRVDGLVLLVRRLEQPDIRVAVSVVSVVMVPLSLRVGPLWLQPLGHLVVAVAAV